MMRPLADCEVLALRRYSLEAAPFEACGLLVPDPADPVVGPRLVWRLPNIADDPECQFAMDEHDIDDEMIAVLEQLDEISARNIVVWHSHPAGTIGPSREDLKFKVAKHALVVAVVDDDIIPTWF